MDHLVRRVTLYCVHDRDSLARSEAQNADIARLAAAGRVEHGAVEPDAALVGGDNPSGAALGVGIITKNQFSHSISRLEVIPGPPRRGEPGIHIPEAGVHGFRARGCAAPRNDSWWSTHPSSQGGV